MSKPKIIFEEKSRSISLTYHINDRKEDMLIGTNILSIAQKNKLHFSTYEDDYSTRCFILKGSNIEQLEEISQQLEKLM